MIEIISSDRCIDCNLCVKVCPTNVFDAVVEDHPIIARQEDCQTCFLCEAYCPVDAMFVAPQADPVSEDSPFLDEQFLVSANLMGRYRHDLGWQSGQTPTAKFASQSALREHFARIEGLPAPSAKPAPPVGSSRPS
jgi:NAD-dependent dihydropyrimidine dehydrogenase PreA subunit